MSNVNRKDFLTRIANLETKNRQFVLLESAGNPFDNIFHMVSKNASNNKPQVIVYKSKANPSLISFCFELNGQKYFPFVTDSDEIKTETKKSFDKYEDKFMFQLCDRTGDWNTIKSVKSQTYLTVMDEKITIQKNQGSLFRINYNDKETNKRRKVSSEGEVFTPKIMKKEARSGPSYNAMLKTSANSEKPQVTVYESKDQANPSIMSFYFELNNKEYYNQIGFEDTFKKDKEIWFHLGEKTGNWRTKESDKNLTMNKRIIQQDKMTLVRIHDKNEEEKTRCSMQFVAGQLDIAQDPYSTKKRYYFREKRCFKKV